MDMNEGRRLTSRQYRLHDLLKEHRDEWLNADDIYRLMNLDLTRDWEAYSDIKKSYNRQIVEDVKQINDDDLIQTIILGDRGQGLQGSQHQGRVHGLLRQGDGLIEEVAQKAVQKVPQGFEGRPNDNSLWEVSKGDLGGVRA